MKEALDLNGNRIGVFKGDKIVGAEGNIIYWVSENEVFSPLEYAEESLNHFNKGAWSSIGILVENECIADGVVIFSIKSHQNETQSDI